VSHVEVDIKKRHVTIAKKQHKVDRLNRTWAELDKNGEGDENSGPMENQRNNIQKQIREIEDEITQVQKEWINNQTSLISKQEENMKVNTDVSDLKTK